MELVWRSRRSFGVAAILLGVSCLREASAQIRVLAPPELAHKFLDSRGHIEGSTATFGAPFYGDKVLGRLVYGRSLGGNQHCADDDYQVPPEEKALHPGGGANSYEEVRLINIIMVRRGKCSFTTKVKVAAAKGAHAVVIVDREDSTLTSKDMHKIIVADDGYGDSIKIPSVLISKEDGKKLIDTVQTSGSVIVEMSWNIPTGHVVVMDLWMSSASRESMKFLKEFSAKRRILNEVIKFQPHYAVFGLPKSDPSVYSGLCTDSTGQYCAEDPDAGGKITGKDVLDEDVRQLCIHELTKVARSNELSLKANTVIEYAQKYWDYVERLPDECRIDAENSQDRFGLECSNRLMGKVGIDANAVNRCFMDTRLDKLKTERENPAWSPRALRINGWRYSGMMEADLVTRAICAGFITPPRECEEILSPRNPFVPYEAPPPGAPGVSFKTFITVLTICVGIAFVAALFYKRSLKQSVRTVLREEVMLEVQAQMGEYRAMQ